MWRLALLTKAYATSVWYVCDQPIYTKTWNEANISEEFMLNDKFDKCDMSLWNC
jgi:hypothetical protein